MANQISSFGRVAASLAGAFAVLTACQMTATPTAPGTKTGTTTGPDVGFTSTSSNSASLAFSLRLDASTKSRLLSLPLDTNSVDITITGAAFGGKTITATVQKSDFVNGLAQITIDKLPLGDATVGVIVKDADGKELGHGSAAAKVEAGKTNPVHITVQSSPQTGALAIVVDSTPDVAGGGFNALPVLKDVRIDRLAIPSLVLVFYGYNGFSRGVLGDPAPVNPVPPPAVAPLDLYMQVQNGTIKDPTRKAIQAGYDGMDTYNAQNPADDRAQTAPHYVAALKAIFNRNDADSKAISELLTPDVQTLDITQGTAFLTSGRALSDDVVDTELKALSGVSAASDKIDKNDKDFTTTFPYLARPW